MHIGPNSDTHPQHHNNEGRLVYLLGHLNRVVDSPIQTRSLLANQDEQGSQEVELYEPMSD